MKYCGTLISVSDMEKAKHFYEVIMEQKVVMDLGIHVSFECGLSLQTGYEELVGEELTMHEKPDNFELYFEVDDLESWEAKIRSTESIEMLHGSKEYPWGQRVIRFYDYDKYIVEVAESMERVVRRFLSEGLTEEETAERTMFPIEFVKQFS